MTEHHYRHHGLTLSCNESLPALTPAPPQTSDVSITVLEPGQRPAGDHSWAAPDAATAWARPAGPEGGVLRLRYARDHEWAEFAIDEHGHRLWAGWAEDVLVAEAAELLLGQVFSCVAAQRGLTCLHASVIELDGRRLALVGPSGAGKSTLALALVERGATLVVDDVAVLRERDGQLAVSRGAPRMRVRPDSARLLVGSFAGLAPMWVHEPRRPLKRYVECPAAAGEPAPEVVPLDAVMFLGPPGSARTESELRRLTGADALPRLMINRHMVHILNRASHRRDFTLLAGLAQSVAAFALTRPEGLGTVRETAAAIEDGFRHID